MTFQDGVNGTNGINGGFENRFSTLKGCREALDTLKSLAQGQIPNECIPLVGKVNFDTVNDDSPYFPCPLKETEAISALKAVEAGVAASIANLIYGEQERKMTVDIERATCFLFSTYLCMVRGMNKADPKVKACLKGLCELSPTKSNPNGSKTPISYTLNQSFTVDSQPTYTRRKIPGNTFIFMDR